MSEKRRGLGRGLGALIPTTSDAERPVDVFFAGGAGTGVASDVLSPRSAVDASDEDPGSRAAASEALGEALDAADDPQGSGTPARTDRATDRCRRRRAAARGRRRSDTPATPSPGRPPA